MKKYAVLSMDIEDWYHLDYLSGNAGDRTHSMLDGLNAFQQLIEMHQIRSSFFVLGELVHTLKSTLRQISDRGHDLGIHGWNHLRPLTMDIQDFETGIRSCKHCLEDVLGRQVPGYRAPCFSLDRERLDIVQEAGFLYDSSRIQFGEHPLYGELNMDGFRELLPGVYRKGEFLEFEISTLRLAGKHIPVSGGGYLRIFPWIVVKKLIKHYIVSQQFYVLYIHPFELSSLSDPAMLRETSLASRFRFSIGRKKVFQKLNALIPMLRKHDFEFTTFSALREKLLGEI